MRTLKKFIKHTLGQYLALPLCSLLLRTLCQLPHSWRLATGRVLGLLSYHLSPNLVHISQRNIELCFPNMEHTQQKQLLKKHYECLGQGVIEMGMAWFLPDKKLASLIDIEGKTHIEEALQSKQGTLIMGLHFTTTELAGRLASLQFPLSVIYQRAKWPLLDQLLTFHRQKIYQSTIPNTHIKQLIRTLKNGHAVWYAPDQAIGKSPVFVPLFGQLAATSTTTSQITQLSKAHLIPVGYYRQSNDRYLIKFHPKVENFPSDNHAQDAERLNEIIEKLILEYPEQYMWQYKRFKKTAPREAYPYND